MGQQFSHVSEKRTLGRIGRDPVVLIGIIRGLYMYAWLTVLSEM